MRCEVVISRLLIASKAFFCARLILKSRSFHGYTWGPCLILRMSGMSGRASCAKSKTRGAVQPVGVQAISQLDLREELLC